MAGGMEAKAVDPASSFSGAGVGGGGRRGGGVAGKPRAADAGASRRIAGHTIYLPDDLFERILVQAHRRRKTISEYVGALLDRQVPDHLGSRGVRPEPPASKASTWPR